MRRVISLWLPRFAIERRRASPDSAPFALFQREGGRELLFAVNAAAEAGGLLPGMTLSQARALCPGLGSEEAAPQQDKAALARLADWAERFTPWVALDGLPQPGGGAGLWLDITGCAHLFGGEEALLRALLAGCRQQGYAGRAGLADTPGAAWALARHGCEPGSNRRRIETGAQREALAPLPLAALRLPAGKAELLARFGLLRIGDLLALPPASLTTRLGPEVAARLRQALGEKGEPLSPRRPSPPQEVRLAFGEPLAAAEDLARAVDCLIGRLCRRLETAGQGVRHLRLTLFRAEGSRQELELATSRATREPAHLARLFAQQRERLQPGFGLDALALAACVVEPLSALQMSLVAELPGEAVSPVGQSTASGPEEAALALLIDRLTLRLGAGAVGCQAPRQSHLPERAVTRLPALPSRRAGEWHPAPPRPLRLLARPEPVEVLAPAAEGVPARFRWRRRLHRVAHAEGPERLSAEWWHDGLAGSRDYFRIEDQDGRRLWLYCQAERWFLHGLFG
ncbi:Y-family DNA polymerase [Aquibaculum sediminis]|uniref:Y-family DNA polymerase n=1 Tax=Aquibaculum sediminis TaxID=3231907 RepID=UPI003453D885